MLRSLVREVDGNVESMLEHVVMFSTTAERDDEPVLTILFEAYLKDSRTSH